MAADFLSVVHPFVEGRIKPVCSVAGELSSIRNFTFVAVVAGRVSSADDAGAGSELKISDLLFEGERHESTANFGHSTEDFVDEEKNRLIRRVPRSRVVASSAVDDAGQTENVARVSEVSAVIFHAVELQKLSDLSNDLSLTNTEVADDEHGLICGAAEGEFCEFSDCNFC